MEERKPITTDMIEMLVKNKLEYLYLASLISSDRILSVEDAENSLKLIDESEKAVGMANISEEKKKEFYEHFNKGREILLCDIGEFKKEKN